MNLNEEKSVRRLENQIEKFEELLDYCIKHRIKNFEKPFADLTMIILGNDIKEISKSVLCLYKNNSSIGIDTLNRVALEKLMYLKRTFNSEIRSRAFYLKIQLKRIEMILKLKEDNEYQKSFCKLSDLNSDEIINEISTKYPNLEKKIQKVFDEYKEIFDYPIPDGWIYRHNWYNFDNETSSLDKLAEKINFKDEFRVFYDIYSSEVHSKSMSKQYRILSEAEATYFSYSSEIIDTSLFHKIIFTGSYLHEVITMFFERYRISNKMMKEYQDSLN